MKTYGLIIALVLRAGFTFAGNENFPTGARNAGMGYCGLTLTDIWGAQHNQANLASLEGLSFGAYYENKYMLSQTALKSVAGAIPVSKVGTFGLSATQFGYSLYSEGKYGLAFARNITPGFAAGIQFNYNTTRIGDIYGKKQAFTAEAGIRARIMPKLTMGAHVYNVSRTLLHPYDTEYIPTTLRLGFEYRFSAVVMALAECETTINRATNIKAGLEYAVHQKVFLRTGINTQPFLAAFGIGYKQNIVSIDIAAAYHQVLGFSPTLSLQIEWRKKTKPAAGETAP